jgi:gluconate kinase
MNKGNNSLLFITFGLPGAGKTYVARVFAEFGFFVHDGDDDLTEDMKTAIATQQPINDATRDAFFAQIVQSIYRLRPAYPRLVVGQTFIKEKYRLLVREHFPEAQFILVEADASIRETRLVQRTHQMLDMEYARKMTLIFEPPLIDHLIITNNGHGEDEIKRQIKAILDSQSL